MSHPEETCQKCERPNVWSWHAPSPLWNAVMRDDRGHDLYGVVCPPCFAELAEAKGVVPPERHTWHFAPEGIDIAALWTARDGRVWDAERCLWVEARRSETPWLYLNHYRECGKQGGGRCDMDCEKVGLPVAMSAKRSEEQ